MSQERVEIPQILYTLVVKIYRNSRIFWHNLYIQKDQKGNKIQVISRLVRSTLESEIKSKVKLLLTWQHNHDSLSFKGLSNQQHLTTNGHSQSRIARPVGSGIPRPPGMVSRLPAPTQRRIPKFSTGSLPGSRASSVGPRSNNSEYYWQHVTLSY